MSTELATAPVSQHRSVVRDMSEKYGMEPQAFEAALRATVVPQSCSPAQFAAFLLVAKKYDLDPVTKQIYAFPSKGGGITPIVGVDGWLHLANSHPAFNGMEFDDHVEGGKLVAITCKVFRKDREKPMACTEYMDECKRDTDPWRKSPGRMLRHRAAIQAIRYAFSFSGIVDDDEYGRIQDSPRVTATEAAPFKLAALTHEVLDPDDAPPVDGAAPDVLENLTTRWHEAFPINKGETNAAYSARFLAWANRVGECDAKVPAELTDDAIGNCNLQLDDIST